MKPKEINGAIKTVTSVRENKERAMRQAAAHEAQEEALLVQLSADLAAAERIFVGDTIRQTVTDFSPTKMQHKREEAWLVIEGFRCAKVRDDGSVYWVATSRQLKKDGTERTSRKFRLATGNPVQINS